MNLKRKKFEASRKASVSSIVFLLIITFTKDKTVPISTLQLMFQVSSCFYIAMIKRDIWAFLY